MMAISAHHLHQVNLIVSDERVGDEPRHTQTDRSIARQTIGRRNGPHLGESRKSRDEIPALQRGVEKHHSHGVANDEINWGQGIVDHDADHRIGGGKWNHVKEVRRRQRRTCVDVDRCSHPNDVFGETSRQKGDVLISGQSDDGEITAVDDVPSLNRTIDCKNTRPFGIVGVDNDRYSHCRGDDEKSDRQLRDPYLAAPKWLDEFRR